MSVEWQITKDDFFIYSDTPDDTTLREDMYQAIYKQYGVDCGWYETDEGGRFITYLIKDYDWDAPIFKIFTQTFADAKWTVNVCKSYIDNLSYNGLH